MDAPARLKKYLEFVRERPDLFDNSGGRLRILLDPLAISEVEKIAAQTLVRRGQPDTSATVGLVFDDPWFFILRDAIEFPDGSRRIIARLVYKNSHGSAVLPMLDGRIVLIRQFRHAPRQWMLEIPRGSIEVGQTPEDAAHAEIREEIGGEIAQLLPIGFTYAANQLLQSGGHLFFAQLKSIGSPQLDEGITAIEQFTVPEVEALIRDGKILDSITLAAFTHARLRGLI